MTRRANRSSQPATYAGRGLLILYGIWTGYRPTAAGGARELLAVPRRGGSVGSVWLTISRAVGYLRVSTREQGRSGLGLAAQRNEIEAFSVREGFAVKPDRDRSSCDVSVVPLIEPTAVLTVAIPAPRVMVDSDPAY